VIPGERTDVAAGAVLARLAGVAAAHLPGALAGDDPEELHDLRVAVRRARSVLREMRGALPPGPAAHLRAELKWVQAVTGPVRDLDVQLEEWEELLALVAAGERAGLGFLRETLEARRREERAAMTEALRSERFAAVLEHWRSFAGIGGEERPIERVAGERIRRIERRMVRDGAAIGDDSPDEALHDLRKRGKELRYMLELFGELLPPESVKPAVRALKRLQDVLGRFQDRSVQIERLRDEPRAAVLVAALRDDQQRARAEFGARFREFARAV
jgi:CHAD domain-containing protein